MLDAAAASRPAPTRQVVLQVLDGGPALSVRNMADPTVRVSVDGQPFVVLAAGEERLVGVEAGSHRILVADEREPRELARASVIVSGASKVAVEVWPK